MSAASAGRAGDQTPIGNRHQIRIGRIDRRRQKMQSHAKTRAAESRERPLQSLQAIGKTLAVDRVMAGSHRPRLLAQQDQAKTTAAGDGERLVELRLAKIGEKEIRLLDPRRLLAPHAAGPGMGHAGRHLEPLDRVQNLGFRAGEHAKGRRLDAVLAQGADAQQGGGRRPHGRRQRVEIFEHLCPLLAALGHDGLNLSEAAGHRFVGRHAVVVKIDGPYAIVVQRIDGALGERHLTPARKVDRQVVVTVATSVVV